MDEHVPSPVTRGLRLRGVDVLTVQDGRRSVDDPALLDRASDLGRAFVTQDEDLLVEAVRRMRGGIPFSGVIFAYQTSITIGKFIADLEVISLAGEIEDLRDRIEWLPLKH